MLESRYHDVVGTGQCGLAADFFRSAQRLSVPHTMLVCGCISDVAVCGKTVYKSVQPTGSGAATNLKVGRGHPSGAENFFGRDPPLFWPIQVQLGLVVLVSCFAMVNTAKRGEVTCA